MAETIKVKLKGFSIVYQQNGRFSLEKVYDNDELPEESDYNIFVPVKVPVWDIFWDDEMDALDYIGSEIETDEPFFKEELLRSFAG